MDMKEKQTLYKIQLRDKIIKQALDLFIAHGIKSVTMDMIANSLSISKRTLYEIFVDKESLLAACVISRHEEAKKYFDEVLKTSDNVLEVIFRCFKYTIYRYQDISLQFHEDLKKYPKAHTLLREYRNKNFDDTVRFFGVGVQQGLFRNDVDFTILCRLWDEQFYAYMNSDLSLTYSFQEVYEAMIFTFLRGISTPKGATLLEKFICEYRDSLSIK